jgi:hypothetical protein
MSPSDGPSRAVVLLLVHSCAAQVQPLSHVLCNCSLRRLKRLQLALFLLHPCSRVLHRGAQVHLYHFITSLFERDQQRPFIAWPGGQKWEAGYALSG